MMRVTLRRKSVEGLWSVIPPVLFAGLCLAVTSTGYSSGGNTIVQPTDASGVHVVPSGSHSIPRSDGDVGDAYQTAVTLIHFCSYVLAVALGVFTVVAGALTFFYKTVVERQSRALEEQLAKANSASRVLEERLGQYDLRFTEFLEDLSKRALLVDEANLKSRILLSLETSAEDCIAAITYLGERGSSQHIPAILSAIRRFPQDEDLCQFALDAIAKLSRPDRIEDTILDSLLPDQEEESSSDSDSRDERGKTTGTRKTETGKRPKKSKKSKKPKKAPRSEGGN